MSEATRRKYIENVDELNNIVTELFATDKSKINDFVEQALILAYRQGWDDVEDMLDIDMLDAFDVAELNKILNAKIDGKTYQDRLNEYLEDGSAKEICRVAENEFHRVYNQGALNSANAVQKETGLVITKTWVTAGDLKVRDTHSYLENTTVRLGERFYTYDNDSAEYPAGFLKPENNINCRCVIEYGMEGV